MQIEVISQIELSGVQRARVGDVLNAVVADTFCQRLRFAVAYMRVSGLDRLGASIDALLNRGGSLSGAVGIDDGVTTIEALEMLQGVSSDSTIFHTVSGFIYHPKLYLMNGQDEAVAIVGSANLTRDGLFRNVEMATAIHLDLTSEADHEVYARYDAFVDQLLNTGNANVQPVTDATLQALVKVGVLKSESQVREPGAGVRSRRESLAATGLETMFPPLRVPLAPPAGRVPRPGRIGTAAPVVTTPHLGAVVFVMQLSAFDCSHRTGVRGTPEVLIPHGAVSFFPAMSLSGKYPEALFDVVLNTPTGRERHRYRQWYYEMRAKGTRIDEYRLRMNHDTIDLTTPGGGDLLVINKLPVGSNPGYEVTILPQRDPTFLAFVALCTNAVGSNW